ncbi:MAG: transporter [Acidobacteriota bacterium]|nr:transporter [Acidobacteriota bacterium]
MTIPVILILIATGFVLKLLIKKEQTFNYLGILANDLLLSFFTFANIASKSLRYLLSLKIVFLSVISVTLVCLVSSYLYGLLFIKKDRSWRGALTVLSVFPNTAALGFPLVALFSKDLTPAVLYSAVNLLLVIPLATFLTIHYSSNHSTHREILTRTLSFPPIPFSLAAIILVLINVQLPERLLDFLQSIGWWCLPLMLVYFGSQLSLKNLKIKNVLEAGLLRMIIPFIFVLLAFRSAAESVFLTILIESSMPPAIMAASLLARHKLKAEEAAAVTLILTLVAIIIIFGLKVLGPFFLPIS